MPENGVQSPDDGMPLRRRSTAIAVLEIYAH